MNFTDREIDLSKQFHKLLKAQGKLPEIREGDWYLEPVSGDCFLNNYKYAGWNNRNRRNDIILLWSWSRCREWLRERGWRLDEHWDDKDGVRLEFWEDMEIKTVEPVCCYRSGQTDLEAILAVMVAVAGEE